MTEPSLFSIVEAFGLGLMASLTACVYPMIPIVTAMFGAGQVRHWTHGFALASIYVGGMAFTYVSLAVVTALTSSIFGSYLGNPIVVFLFVLFFLVLGLMLVDVIPFPFPNIAEKFHVEHSSSILYPLLLGVVSGFIAGPCAAPFFGKIMGDIASAAADGGGGLTMPISQAISFSLGMGMPFLLVGGFSVRLPKPGKWMQAVKYFGAAILFAAAFHYLEDNLARSFPPPYSKTQFVIVGFFIFIIFFMLSEPLTMHDTSKRTAKMSIALLLLLSSFGLFLVTSPFAKPRIGEQNIAGGGQKGHKSHSDAGHQHGAHKWHSNLAAGFAAAEKTKGRVLIDFWAEWCTACHEMEEQLFTSPEFKEFVKESGLILVRLDFTKESEGNQKIAERYGIMGLPTLILANSQGSLIDSIIGFQSPELAMKLLRQAVAKKDPQAKKNFSHEHEHKG